MNTQMVLGFFSSWIVYALILFLHQLLPGRWVNGYLKHEKTGKPFRYRLNGLFVLCTVLVLYWLAGNRGLIPYDFLWVHRWESLAGAVVLGLIVSFSLVLTAPSTGKSFLADFYLGRRPNPQ
ncbi:MAG: ergosterol biosynthesis protein, partial [Spirochaetia bacterium]|nr:ergosterol biosynthesis protein [Spirochaetia bacterium]